MNNQSQIVEELVVVGSGGVGKSCLTVRFLKDEFTSDYDPTIEENYRKSIVVDEIPCIVNIVDTAGQQEYTALRDQHFQSGKGFLLVFALNDAATFEEVKQLKDQIIKLKDTKRVPLMMCGNKCDLPEKEVDTKVVQAYCQQNKIPYLETSAKSNINVTESFHELVRECRKKTAAAPNAKGGNKQGGGSSKNKGKKGCTIL
ncbi:ras family-domain-containing protein [Neocallimastix lanati (nom. inval.)]|jgi:GTPase KRas protein|uniref:Ras-domain-containing protein n=1 Tax=Neocallimastix californiae TaxID=1754190 RepID=A0A1Y2AJ07_9FUNG|nr:ras family-domain-containing protein [Neocallimastix sp. JGI-2020a]ORY21915.1 ras-domain-containing protein [Neocallimastix californiae]|eukprot:ORY21915.1 ras-domain-containing protein [Neocallimastix californiae]